ncbi:hypothetical protein RyT2_14940 [Pseudolactococcus yaeyamensis]
MVKISFKGIDKLQKKLESNLKLEAAKEVVKKNSLDLQGQVVKNAGESTFNKGFFTGNLKQTVSGNGLKIEKDGLTGKVGTTAEYGAYLEHGTRFMAAEPFMKPSLDIIKPQFKQDMEKLTK